MPVQAPPKTGIQAPKPGSYKHQRRASKHERRRSQHSIASFGDIAEISIKSPGLGGLAEGIVSEHNEIETDYKPGQPNLEAGNAHNRRSSNVHLLFDGEEDMQNIVATLMEENSNENSDLEGDTLSDRSSDRDRHSHSDDDVHLERSYSPVAIDLDDARQKSGPTDVAPERPGKQRRGKDPVAAVEPSPRSPKIFTKTAPSLEPSPSRTPPTKQRNTDRNERRSFAGIADLFEDEDDDVPHSRGKQSQFVKDQINQLQEDNQRLKKELEKSEESRRQLENEIEEMRRLQSSSEVQEELRRVKESKINLIQAAGGEIDRLRRLLSNFTNGSYG